MVSEWQEDSFLRQVRWKRSLDIYVVNADGTEETNLTRTQRSSEGAPS